MEFSIRGHKVSLRGMQPSSNKVIQQMSMAKLLAKPVELCMIFAGMFRNELSQEGASLFSLEVSQDEVVSKDIQSLLVEFNELFEVPKELSPSRLHDHIIITLKEGTSPINIRPYRYPTIQKNEIEKMVDKMFSSGVIKHSNSPYSSPIVMVKKKDGS
ncbi:hypothetical protein KY285_026867 [Solanum tuberosum]|nr:hypothetical protein KY285_026867 [Solanum tuberosum]